MGQFRDFTMQQLYFAVCFKFSLDINLLMYKTCTVPFYLFIVEREKLPKRLFPTMVAAEIQSNLIEPR